MLQELNHCPFCGCEAKLMHGFDGMEKASYVKCVYCGAQTAKFVISTEYAADALAAEAWNGRAGNATGNNEP